MIPAYGMFEYRNKNKKKQNKTRETMPLLKILQTTLISMFACEYVFQTKSKNNIYKKKTL
jgi:hypothetical protein